MGGRKGGGCTPTMFLGCVHKGFGHTGCSGRGTQENGQDGSSDLLSGYSVLLFKPITSSNP